MSARTAAVRNNARIFFVGGAVSYRAQFNWLSPWVLIPSMLIEPIAQILLFAYIGRAAGVGNDEFYVIGNALNYAAIPCLFAMSATIAGERWGQTLEIVFATPAARLPLFLGRALPVIVNGWLVSMFGIVVGSLLLDVHIPGSAWPAITLVVLVTSLSCAGLGLVMGGLALRIRDGATIGNVLFLTLLVFCGTNVALSDLPAWMGVIGRCLPLTAGIEAARGLADGASLGSVRGLVARELLVGVVYVSIGMVLVRTFEWLSRRGATLSKM